MAYMLCNTLEIVLEDFGLRGVNLEKYSQYVGNFLNVPVKLYIQAVIMQEMIHFSDINAERNILIFKFVLQKLQKGFLSLP